MLFPNLSNSHVWSDPAASLVSTNSHVQPVSNRLNLRFVVLPAMVARTTASVGPVAEMASTETLSVERIRLFCSMTVLASFRVNPPRHPEKQATARIQKASALVDMKHQIVVSRPSFRVPRSDYRNAASKRSPVPVTRQLT
jgi:hypothetical protein